jgi:hypothetical protein
VEDDLRAYLADALRNRAGVSQIGARIAREVRGNSGKLKRFGSVGGSSANP